jgi:uncharacterized protein (DUF433 family)
MSIADLEAQIAELSSDEKAQLLQKLSQEMNKNWRGIEKTPGVVGGEARISGSRIPVWLLESYRRLGWSEAQLLDNYPTLRAADLVNAWAYIEAHPEEIDKAIQKNEID